jgi:hypothetical protein
MYNVTIFFCDRTNVRSKLLLLGHLPNLVGHCPMSDSNLQPCICIYICIYMPWGILNTYLRTIPVPRYLPLGKLRQPLIKHLNPRKPLAQMGSLHGYWNVTMNNLPMVFITSYAPESPRLNIQPYINMHWSPQCLKCTHVMTWTKISAKSQYYRNWLKLAKLAK